MAQRQLTVTVRLAWWLRPYLFGVALTSTLMGVEPDWDKVTRVIDRALRYRFN
jgi:hypothetical protein